LLLLRLFGMSRNGFASVAQAPSPKRPFP
jgi:hypothetical protein